MIKQHIKRKSLLVFLFFFSVIVVKAQTQVEGKVSDQEGIELIGVSVIIKGQSGKGTITDLDGKYELSITDPSKDVLVFSYLGMQEQEVNINGRKVVNVTMGSNDILLDEVVAIGYGTMKRSDISGSVSSLKGKEVAKIPVTNLAQALSGKIAGVQVIQSQGSPDANIELRIRGGASITQGNEPLYIIDGFQSESGMQGLDPSDIESIDVLKDASATAIYGAAGANGVVLITTKGAKEGKPVISYDMHIGFKKLTKTMDVLNGREFVGLEYERAIVLGEDMQKSFLKLYVDPYDPKTGPLLDAMYGGYLQLDDIYGNRNGVAWQDEVFKKNNPLSMNHKIGVSGGTDKSTYNVSYSYSNDGGIMEGSGLKRNNIRGQFVQKLSNKISMTFNATYSDERTTGMGSLNDSGQFSRMQHIIQHRPIYKRYADDRDLIEMDVDSVMDESGNQMQNPLRSIQEEERERKNKNLVLNASMNYSILKNLKYRGTVGLRHRTTSHDMFYHSKSRQAINKGGPLAQTNSYEYDVLQFNNTLTWNKTFDKKHKLDIMLGQEYYNQLQTFIQQNYTGFPDSSFGLDDVGLAQLVASPNTDKIANRKLSYFGRVNYNLSDKYLATATFRADGSSKFPNNKWGYFPAISFAWRAAEENFIKNLNTFSDLKLRASYGIAGNENIKPYLGQDKIRPSQQPFNNSLETSFGRIQLANPFIKWETNITANFGLDFGFLQQRIQGSIDVYQNDTKDLLLNAKIPYYMGGYGSVMENSGKTRNRGIEFSLNSVNVQGKDFTWITSLNLAHNKNTVKKLIRSDYFTVRSGWIGASEFNEDDYIIRVGDAVGLMYGYKLEGNGVYGVEDFTFDDVSRTYTLKPGIASDGNVAPQPGDWKFADVDQSEGEKGVINNKDRTVIGKASPDLIGGISNSFTYKWFDLSFNFAFRLGGDVYNANKMYFTKLSNKYRNSLAMAAGRFTYIDETGANVFKDPAKLASINRNPTMASVEATKRIFFHSGFVEDGSYLRLDNLTFGYTLPRALAKKCFLQNLRVYGSAYNLFTISGYDGFDPDVNVRPNSGLTPNVDWGAYPRSLTFVFGLNVTL